MLSQRQQQQRLLDAVDADNSNKGDMIIITVTVAERVGVRSAIDLQRYEQAEVICASTTDVAVAVP